MARRLEVGGEPAELGVRLLQPSVDLSLKGGSGCPGLSYL